MFLLQKKILVVLASTSVAIAVAAGTASAALSPTETGLLRAVNRTRLAHGLRPLRLDPRLERAAREHSRSMLRGDYFAHGDFGRRMLAVHAPGVVRGEDLAWGSGSLGTPGALVRAWLHSPPHRRNLLRPGFRRIGIGALRGTFLGYGDTTVVTADFAGS